MSRGETALLNLSELRYLIRLVSNVSRHRSEGSISQR